MKSKIIGVVLVLLFALTLFGCTQNTTTIPVSDVNNTIIVDTNSDSSLNDLNPNSTNLSEGLFCQTPETFKFSYDEKYYTKEGEQGVTMKRYFKQTPGNYYYYERLSTLSEGVGTWNVATPEEYMVYSNADGECVAMKQPIWGNPFSREAAAYYSDQFTGELKQIGGSEIGWKLIQTQNLDELVGSEIVTIADYISKEYCLPLTQDINSLDFVSHSEKVNFSKEFSDSLFEVPQECLNASVVDLTIN